MSARNPFFFFPSSFLCHGDVHEYEVAAVVVAGENPAAPPPSSYTSRLKYTTDAPRRSPSSCLLSEKAKGKRLTHGISPLLLPARCLEREHERLLCVYKCLLRARIRSCLITPLVKRSGLNDISIIIITITIAQSFRGSPVN